jgi:rod shape-determining protein MreC
MESVLGRYRNLTILVGVLFLQVLGLAVQVKRSGDAEHTRLIRIWAVDAITPFERALVRAQDYGAGLWRDYFFLRGVRAENHQLKEQIEKMRLEQVRLSEDAAQARRLQSLLSFKEQVIGKPVAAQVIGSSGSDLSRSIYIDKGSNDGIAQDMPVITANGIVGKVWLVYPSTSLVLMINDQSSGVGVFLEKSRLQGVLRGTPTGELVLERVMSDEQVAPGEAVLSSGGDQIFPKGLSVGTVTQVSPGREMFLNIKVKPAADLSRLEEVLVITEKQEQQPVAQSGTRVRAADILAQRLPSVPDKPAAAASAIPGAAGSRASGTTAPGVKPQTSGAAKPLAGNAMKPVVGFPSQVGRNRATPDTAHNANVAAQPAAVSSVKTGERIGQKAAGIGSAVDSGPDGATGSNSQNTSRKPVVAQPKPSNAQSAQQPSGSQDDPH